MARSDEAAERLMADPKVGDFMRVFRHRYRHQLDETEAESTANYALAKALAGWDEAKANGRRFSTHLFTVLGWEFDRAAEKEARHRAGRRTLNPRWAIPAPDPGAEPANPFAEHADYVRRYLPPLHREVLRQYHAEERTAAEIGGNLGLTEGRVLRVLRAAEGMLRAVVDQK